MQQFLSNSSRNTSVDQRQSQPSPSEIPTARATMLKRGNRMNHARPSFARRPLSCRTPTLQCAGFYPRGSVYSMFEDSGSKSHSCYALLWALVQESFQTRSTVYGTSGYCGEVTARPGASRHCDFQQCDQRLGDAWLPRRFHVCSGLARREFDIPET